MSITTKTKKTQCQRLLAYLRKNRKGITSLEAAKELDMVCLHKRIAELEGAYPVEITHQAKDLCSPVIRITRTDELSATGSTVTRYKLAR
jgi:hypothetical protein